MDGLGRCLATETQPHAADVVGLAAGFSEQDPHGLLSAANAVLNRLERICGPADGVGWTGQMHGVVGVDADLKPVTNLVTWRDRRRYGGRIMSAWHAGGLRPFKCLPVCALALHEPVVDESFLHSWYLDEPGLSFPRAWLPDVVDGCMLGDNQAGVYAVQQLYPGSAVVNIGTSAQLSVLRERPFAGRAVPGDAAEDGARTEFRPYPGGRTLECRASLIGGPAWAALRQELGLSWEEMNVTDDSRIRACAARIVGDLFRDVDLTGVTELVGVGNALVRNPALVRELEARSGLQCRIPDFPELAAAGAAFRVMDRNRA